MTIHILQTRLFSNSDYKALENDINSFLFKNSNNVVLIDIKYSTVNISGSGVIKYSALIIYK